MFSDSRGDRTRGVRILEVTTENGTIYGQVFPAKTSISGHALNVVEQINQTWTYVVALAAARHLMEMHPEAGGYVLAPGAHAAIELDIMSEAPGLVGAETVSGQRYFFNSCWSICATRA